MKYIILQRIHYLQYAAVDLSNDTIGAIWKDSIPEAITELHNSRNRGASLEVFGNLRATPIEDYPTLESDNIFKFHSIADSDINPEFFI